VGLRFAVFQTGLVRCCCYLVFKTRHLRSNWTWLRGAETSWVRSRVLFGRAGRYQSWKLILVTERMMLACNINVVVPFVRDHCFHIAKLFFVSFHSTTISHFPWSSNLTLKQGVCVMRAYRPAAHVFGSSCSAVGWHVPAVQLVIACQHAALSVHVLGLDKQTGSQNKHEFMAPNPDTNPFSYK
jgi:hypothetical protein